MKMYLFTSHKLDVTDYIRFTLQARLQLAITFYCIFFLSCVSKNVNAKHVQITRTWMAIPVSVLKNHLFFSKNTRK